MGRDSEVPDIQGKGEMKNLKKEYQFVLKAKYM